MTEGKLTFLDKFKAISIFLSTVVISATGLYLNYSHNLTESVKTSKIANAQIEVARINAITEILPKLAAKDTQERRLAAISLGLYGKTGIPALLAALDDPEQMVVSAAIESLAVIGETAFPALKRSFLNEQYSDNVRAGSIYAIAKMRHPDAAILAREAVFDETENMAVRRNAGTALGFIKDKKSVPGLINLLKTTQNKDLIISCLWSLGQIGDKSARNIVETYLSHEDETVKQYAEATLDRL